MRHTRFRRGNMVLEAALWIPVIVLLLVGMVQIGKVTYLYYSLKKAVYSAARYISVQQGVNFCDLSTDPNVAREETQPELERLMNIAGEPIFAVNHRWPDSMP